MVRDTDIESKSLRDQQEEDTTANVRVVRDTDIESKSLRDQHLTDTTIAPVLKWKELGQRPSWTGVSAMTEDVKIYSLQMREGALYRRWESPRGDVVLCKFILPKTERTAILRQLHDEPTEGHLGGNKTLGKVHQRFYCAKCRVDVDAWCRRCDTCAAKKGTGKKARSPLQQYDVGCPMERIALDFMGCFLETKAGNRHLLVVMDYFTKWPEAYALPNQEASSVASVLVNEFTSRYGVPAEIHSYQGRNFESAMFAEMCQLLGSRRERLLYIRSLTAWWSGTIGL